MFRIDRRYVLPVVIALGLLASLFAISEIRKSEVKAAAAQIWMASDRLRMLTDVRALLTDAETGQRGFLLTGDRSYLEPFLRAREGLPQALEQIRGAYAGDPSSLERLDELGRLVAVKTDELDSTIAANDQRGVASALQMVEAGDGERAMESLRTLIDGMRTDERARLATAQEVWKHAHLINSVVMAATTLLNMFLVVVAGVLLTRDLDRRRSENERLNAEVATRTRDLDELSSYLQNISEREKGTLARELHDELGALLVAVKMDLSQLRRHLPQGNPEVEQRWARIQSSLSEGIDLKRRVVEQLRPTLLDNMGLSAALKWQLQESCGRAGIVCREHFPEEEPSITGEAAIAIFRIVQESLTNVIKHARAQTVDVTLAVENEQLVVTVEDDGVGLSGERANAPGFHGLTSMRHRVRYFGGNLTFERSENKRGTRVRITIPMARIAPLPEPVAQAANA